MSLEAPASDVEVRFEDHLQLMTQGHKGRGSRAATVVVPTSRARSAKHSHIVVCASCLLSTSAAAAD